MTDFYGAFHKTFDKRFPKFVTNLVILLRSCQSSHELQNKGANFTPNLRSSSQAKFASFGVAGLVIYNDK